MAHGAPRFGCVGAVGSCAVAAGHDAGGGAGEGEVDEGFFGDGRAHVVGGPVGGEGEADVGGGEGVVVGGEGPGGEGVGGPEEGGAGVGVEELGGELDCFADAAEGLERDVRS